MEEILKDLIKTTLEKGPQNKQFYSNLSITKPIHDHAEIQLGLRDAVEFLKSKFHHEHGFQSKLYTNRNCAIKCEQVNGVLRLPENVVEIYSSILALDLLFYERDNENLVVPSFQEIICNFSADIQDSLHSLIVPSFGISTFNLFKHFQETSPVPSSPVPLDETGPLEFDSGNDSPISMNCSSLQNNNSVDEIADLFHEFPNDINTTALALHVLLHQGIIQGKPVESILGWIISNVFNFSSQMSDNATAASDEETENSNPLEFPTFISKQGNNDPVGVANVLNLMYLLDISHEVFLNSAEEFLVLTLKNLLTTINAQETSESSVGAFNSLGNTQKIISSGDNGQKHYRTENEAKEDQQQSTFVLQHHSPDSLLYFLSRTLAIPTIHNTNSAHGRRPYINQLKSLLVKLLEARLGTTMSTCDLAMRILAGAYLGLMTTSPNNTSNLASCSSSAIRSNSRYQREMLQVQQNELYCSTSPLLCDTTKILRINNLLQKEFELLVSLQNDVDGFWPADSVVQVGFCDTGGFDNNDVENDALDRETEIETVGYLGGKELATLFAMKAISVFLSQKKGQCLYEDEVGWGDVDSSNNYEDQADSNVHQLY